MSDGGYLYDPDSKRGHSYNPDVVPFESIAEIPCLILLGEPGIGKTHAMQAEQEAIDAKVKKEGNETLWLNLRSYKDEERLLRNLFGSPAFVSWIEGIHRLHVFLDSLDECLLRIDTLAMLLVDEFKKYPVERLYLRIACRTADWPNGLEEGLKQLWGDDVVKLHELAPLRRMDVIEAAKANDLAPDTFLREIDRREAVPLATKPITLDFLLNTYRRTGQFPSTQAKLYLEGCRLLCEETSESRRDARLTGTFTAEQRMTVAARIAAITVFSNRYAIWTDIDRGDVPDEDVTIQNLYGGKESVNGNEFEVSEAAIRETLNTGLFSSRGPNRMGWAHQTYAEFLAARYFVQSKMALDQVMSLLVHPGDPDGKLVPQLHESAAWLAGMVPDVFRKIMEADPAVLLQSDVATADVKDRSALVATLLGLYDEEKLLDFDLNIRRQYRKLTHPTLAEQLQLYICDKNKGIIVRRVAIDIAKSCELQILQTKLTEIALDPSQPLLIRTNAACAIAHVGDNEEKVKLKTLTTGEASDDPNDDLKAYGLRSVWPDHMTAEELFSAITRPKQKNLIGIYHSFLSHDLMKHLQPSDLPSALKWAEEQQPRRMLPSPFEMLCDNIMLQAWEHLESPGVLQAFAKAALSRLRHHEEIAGDHLDSSFGGMLCNDDEKRHRILEAVFPMLLDPRSDPRWLVYSRTPLTISKDVPWMIERFQAAKTEESQQVWAKLMEKVFDLRDPGQVEAIIVASQNSSILTEAFARHFQVELDSTVAREMREDYLEMQRWQEQEQDRSLLEPPPSKRILMRLEECESGNSAAWWCLTMEMTLEPDSTHYKDEFESDLTTLPGWKTAESETRVRIVEAAKKYVMEQDPEVHEWLGTNTLYRPAFAGYRALRLLLQEAPDFIRTIPAEVWKKWAPVILAYSIFGDIEGEEPHQIMVKISYQFAPTEIIECLMCLIDKEDEERGQISITRKVEGCWDDRLANALLVKAKDNNLKPESVGNLLGDLLDHEVDGARVFAESLVTLPPPSDGDWRSRAIVGAQMLIAHTRDAGWTIVWPAIQQDAEFGREVIEAVSRFDWHIEGIGQRLTEDQLSDLFIWLVRQYPPDEDPEREEARFMKPREYVAGWKNSILRYLENRGTYQACEAIRRIAHELPELEWLKWTLLEAQNVTRHCTWTPPQPGDVLKIARDREKRLVQSEDQLLEVLIESLERLEKKLHGETPAVQFLWDKTCRDTYQPKDEKSFSDYVKIHLDEDLRQRGIIVNREVEIHRGERTDIHVDAIVRSSQGEVYDSITAIIEVKGCWNTKLNHEMKTQLVDRYLKDNRCQHGLYLVGWFNCNQWDSEDYRKGQVPKISIDEARRQFDDQAASLSQQGLRIKAFVIDTALC